MGRSPVLRGETSSCEFDRTESIKLGGPYGVVGPTRLDQITRRMTRIVLRTRIVHKSFTPLPLRLIPS